jgi:phage shock protein A
MSLRLGALHDALLSPGDADLARKAAEEVAGYENQLAAVRSDLLLIKWMLGAVLAMLVSLLFKVFGG